MKLHELIWYDTDLQLEKQDITVDLCTHPPASSESAWSPQWGSVTNMPCGLNSTFLTQGRVLEVAVSVGTWAEGHVTDRRPPAGCLGGPGVQCPG